MNIVAPTYDCRCTVVELVREKALPYRLEVVLFAGATTPDEITRFLLSAGGTVAFAAAMFLYLIAYGIAVVYVDCRIHPASYSFWRAVGSTALMYFGVLLPILVAVGVALLFAAGMSMFENTRP